MKAPRNSRFIVNEFGDWGMLFTGHALDREPLVAAADKALGGDAEEWDVQERFYRWVPRVKNCAEHPHGDGTGCEQEGKWHGHWFEVKPTDDPKYHFTEVRARAVKT